MITCLVSEKTWENKSEILELFICLIHYYYSILYTVLKNVAHFSFVASWVVVEEEVQLWEQHGLWRISGCLSDDQRS